MRDLDAFDEMGLELDDFAVFDDAPDYLLLLQQQESALRQAEETAERFRRMAEDLTYQASHDSLTGLGNRSLFATRLNQARERQTSRPELTTSMLFLDLDDFKKVNDRLGHAAGDQFLIHVGQRLLSCVSEIDTVVRFGGDEFAVLVQHVDPSASVAVAEQILASLADLSTLGSDGVRCLGTLGLVVGAEELAEEETLRRADVAMYFAKARGKARFAVYEPFMDERSPLGPRPDATCEAAVDEGGDVARVAELKAAIDGGQLRLHFQPDLTLTGEVVSGFEALVRWQHPDGRLIPPTEFIGLAEDNGLVVPLGRWVLDEACRQAAAWIQRLPNLTVSVNVSSQQLDRDDFCETVSQSLHRSGLDPRRLCLEITETVLIRDVEASIATLLAVRALGVRVALDDFGTGYSSLSYLRRLPVDVVKIDRSFVTELGVEQSTEAIIGAIVNLSHALGFEVVAEGLETELQLVALRALGCERGQGYYWSRPLPAGEFEDWLATPRPSALDVVEVDMPSLVSERAAALHDATGRRVLVQLPKRLRGATADRRAVGHVLDQLLGNATQFSSAQTPVIITAASDRRWVRLSVADYGGMHPEQADRCFEPFWHGGLESGATGSSGSGMGLYVARSLVTSMGGRIGVKTAPGKGSTFTVALPRSVSVAQRSLPPSATSNLGENSVIQEFMRQMGVPASTASTTRR